eukprot:NODE_6353_length_515_cov_65.459227_g5581_i0.p2 GENE.NODE_6353_length_515_cov_65.459227_g5581_i0~~NODE_6353_length_515_cov_65.459227_g5581_i0.p2  ORF type:complete len:105 (+),score=50.75 NODE_6353_length_515_cov_65.459227_g5581_i0:42-317(+)
MTNLRTIVPPEILDSLGSLYISQLWDDLVYEWQVQSENDHEEERKEQEERVRTGVANAMADSFALMNDMESKIGMLEGQLRDIHNLLRAQR